MEPSMQNTKNSDHLSQKGTKTSQEIIGMMEQFRDFFAGNIFKQALLQSIEAEIEELTGKRYQRNESSCHRWGSNPGSLEIDGEKIPISVPRLRDKQTGATFEPPTYKALTRKIEIPEKVYRAIIAGLSQSQYKYVAKLIAKSFGLSQGSVSRKFQHQAKKLLKDYHERDFSQYRFVALMIDGKYLAKEQIVHALGITDAGDKISLGFVQTTTENSEAIKGLLRDLVNRNFHFHDGILLVSDGAKGIKAAANEVFGRQYVHQRCQWHKRENVVSYLPEKYKEEYRQKMRFAYQALTYEHASSLLKELIKELEQINDSAARSLREGMEETLTLHQLGVKVELDRSLSTTNCIENLNSQIANRLRNIKRWRPGIMRSYWIASALFECEKTMRRISGCDKLYLLRIALKNTTSDTAESGVA